MLRTLCMGALCACVLAAVVSPSVSLGDDHAVASWDFTPVYSLPLSAENYPGRNYLKEPVAQDPFAPIPRATFRFFGQDPTEHRFLPLDGPMPLREFSLEAMYLLHVNQPISAMLGTVGYTDGVLTGWHLSLHDREFHVGAAMEEGDPVLLSSGRAEAFRKRWYHVVATVNEETIRIHINGEEATAMELPNDIRLNDQTMQAFTFFANEPRLTLGEVVRNAHLYSRVLTQDEIEARFAKQSERVVNGHFKDEAHFVVGPMLNYPTREGISISWETSQPSTAVVKYGFPLPMEDELVIDEAREIHGVTLTGLEADQPYFYQIIATTEDGTELDSGVLTFQTAVDSEKDAFKFAVFADTETRPNISNEMGRQLWEHRPQFLMNLGDLTDGGFEPYKFEWTYEYLAPLTPIFSRIPVLPAIGNGEADAYWYKRYHVLPEPETYYHFPYANADFYFIDSNRDLSAGSEQYEWLNKQLSVSDATWKIVSMHHPAFSSDENDHGNTYEGPSTMGVPNSKNLITLYEEYDVDLVLFGHVHSYERTWPVRDGEVDLKNGVTYIQTGGGGGNLEDFAPTRNWFTSQLGYGHHYNVVSVQGNYLQWTTYDLERNIKDQFELTKPDEGETIILRR